MPPKQRSSSSSSSNEGNSFVISDFPIAGLQQLFGLAAGIPGLRVTGSGNGASFTFGRSQQQQPAVEHRGVGHIFQGEMHPRQWIDREQRRGQSPNNNNNNRSRNNTNSNSNNNNNTTTSSSSSASSPVSQPESAASLRDRGNEAFRHGHLQEALSLYTAALNLNPACETALTNRATTHFKLKNYEAAAADARRAIQIKPDYFKAHYRLGMSLSQLGYYEEAMEALKHAETLSDDDDTKQDIRIQIAKAESKLKTRNAAQEDAAEKMIQQAMTEQQQQVGFGSPISVLSSGGGSSSQQPNLNSSKTLESPTYASSFPPITPLAGTSFPADVPLPTGTSSSSSPPGNNNTATSRTSSLTQNQLIPASGHHHQHHHQNHSTSSLTNLMMMASGNRSSSLPSGTVSLDAVADLAREARNWRGFEEEGETFVNEHLVEALGLLTSKTTAEHEKHILQECNPESLQQALDEYNQAQDELRTAAKDNSNREKFHSALRKRDEKLHAALKTAAKSKFALQKLHELRSRNDACRAVIDRQLQTHHHGFAATSSASATTNSSITSVKNINNNNNEDSAAVDEQQESNNKEQEEKEKEKEKEKEVNQTDDAAGSTTSTTIDDIPQLIQEYKKLRTELAGEVQSAMAKTDKAAAEFLQCLKEEQRILQDTGRDRNYFKPLRSISSRLVKVARQKLDDQAPLLPVERVREIDALIRRADADRASLQRATFEGQNLLDAESALERDRLNFERQRIQLQAEFDWLLVKEEEDERKLQSLRRNIERVKEQSSAISKKQHDIQQKILRLIDTDLPELAWKAAAGGKKILKWAKGSGYWVNLSLSDFEIIRTLATTPSSKVLQARSKRDGTIVAIKEVQVDSEAHRRRFQNEVNIVSGLASHRNVVQIQGVFFDGPFAYIVLPYFELGSLLDWIKQGIKKHPMKEWRLQEFLRQIVSGLASLHDQGVLHNDVKLNNLLLGDELTPVLSDFGLARDVGRYSERADVTYDTTNFQGTQNYAAPELLNPPQIDSLMLPSKNNNNNNHNGLFSASSNRVKLLEDDADVDSSSSKALATVDRNNNNSAAASSSSSSAAMLASPVALAMSTGKPTMRSDIYSLGITLLQIAAANHKALQEEKEERARKQKEEKEQQSDSSTSNNNNNTSSTRRNEGQQANDDDDDDSSTHHRSTLRQAVHADAAVEEESTSAASTSAAAAATSSTPSSTSNNNNNNSNNNNNRETTIRGSDLTRALVLHSSSSPSAKNDSSSSPTLALTRQDSSSSSILPFSAENDYLLDIPATAAGKTVDPRVVGDDRLADLLTEMIAVDPSARPSAQEILAHPYFSVSLLEESVRSHQLEESNHKLEALSSHIHALRAIRRNPVLVSVERNQMVESVSSIVSQLKDEALLNPLFVVFRGEEGLDEGGLTGELIQNYFMQAITNHRLLKASVGNEEQSPSCSLPMQRESTAVPPSSSSENKNDDDDTNHNNNSNNNSDDIPLTGGTGRVLDSDPVVMLDTPYLPSEDKLIPPGLFETMGRILVKSLIENRSIPILLSSVVFKHIVGVKPNMLDLEEYDRSLWRSLRQFQFLSAEDLEAAMMSFDEFPAAMLTDDLKFDPSICNKDVTPDNVKDYITAKAYHTLVYSRKTALDAIKTGFFACKELNNHLKLMSPIELQIALCGQQHITPQDVISLLDFVNFPSDSNTPKLFVESITNMSQNNLRRFLRLTTSSVTIPRGGQGRSARIRVVCTHDLERLPVGHTCVNQLDLPNYNDREKLNKQLATALAHAEDGFFVM